MAELPVMPVKTDALLADTSHMSAEEFGAYCRLLFVMWRHGGKLRDDDKELAAIAGIQIRRWSAVKSRVTRPMTIIGGFVSQKRLTDTWLNVQEVRQKRALASAARWKPKGRANGMHLDVQMESQCNPNQISKKEDSFLTETAREVRDEQADQKRLRASPELLAIISRPKR
jgi:uncharacterized protein YdaU (DUF1376 family)